MAAGADRVAVISDLHGNLTALQAVLADIDARGIERVLNLGDLIGKGPRGSECIAVTRQRCAVTVRGNWDAFVSDLGIDVGPEVDWVRERLSDADLAWLAALPNAYDFWMSGRRVRLFHASQASEFHRVHMRHSEEEFRAMFTNTAFTGGFLGTDATPDVVGYGDIHSTYLEADEGLLLFNAGSAGNHLDAPSAPYVVLEGDLDSPDEGALSVSFVRVPYDIEAEIAAARDLGMPDVDVYAVELRDGIYRGRQNRD